MADINSIIEKLAKEHGPLETSEYRGQTRVVATRDQLFDLLRSLKETFDFDLLVDVTCVDYLNYREARDRFGMVYLLAQSESAERLTVRCFIGDADAWVPSVVPLWEGANWMEREVFDMFGIKFEGHGDLRRILMPEPFVAFPLRKDYPLQGRGERHNFEPLTRSDG